MSEAKKIIRKETIITKKILWNLELCCCKIIIIIIIMNNNNNNDNNNNNKW